MKYVLHMVAAASLMLFSVQTAQAQEAGEAYGARPVRAPRDAFEVGVNAGYTQGFGSAGEGEAIGRIAGPGVGVSLDLSYRIAPMVALSLGAEYQELAHGERVTDASARGVAPGLSTTIHYTPFDRIDAWGKFGVGYRFLWEVRPDAPTALRHGFRIAELTLGFDWRITRDIGIGPFVGADVTALLWSNETRPGDGSPMMDRAGVSSFVHAGLQGRFDLTGRRVAPSPTTATR